MFDMTKKQGEHTYHPDCSDKSAAHWGFDTFENGTVGAAIHDWIINVWDEIDPEDLRKCVIEEFNFYMQDMDMAVHFADAWIRDHGKLLRLWTSNPLGPAFGMMAYDDGVKEWLTEQAKIFLDKS